MEAIKKLYWYPAKLFDYMFSLYYLWLRTKNEKFLDVAKKINKSKEAPTDEYFQKVAYLVTKTKPIQSAFCTIFWLIIIKYLIIKLT